MPTTWSCPDEPGRRLSLWSCDLSSCTLVLSGVTGSDITDSVKARSISSACCKRGASAIRPRDLFINAFRTLTTWSLSASSEWKPSAKSGALGFAGDSAGILTLVGVDDDWRSVASIPRRFASAERSNALRISTRRSLSASFEWEASDGSGVLGSWDEILRVVTLVGPYGGWSNVSLLPRRFALAARFNAFTNLTRRSLAVCLRLKVSIEFRRARLLGRARRRRHFTWSG